MEKGILRTKKSLKSAVLLCLIGVMLITSCSKDDEPVLIPKISGITPVSGPKRTIVSIDGTDFGTDSSTLQVFFNGVEAEVQAVKNTQIMAVVPPRAFTGVVKVISDGKTLTGPEFTYTISDVQVTTYAGSTKGATNGTKNSAQFNSPKDMTIDIRGNIYVADLGNHRIRKITPSGIVSTVAGTTEGFEDGPARNAKFSFPEGIAVDRKGNIYVADTYNHKIRKINSFGLVSTLAGSTPGFANGTGSAAQFMFPAGVAIDSKNNIIVTDQNERIRKITPAGEVSTIAGSSIFGFADGIGTNAKFNGLSGIAIDSEDNIYVVDIGNSKIRKITPSGEVSTLAGSTSGYADGKGAVAQFYFEEYVGLTVDVQGNIYVVDINNNKIRKITPSGRVSTLAGSAEGFTNGIGNVAQFSYPSGVVVNKQRTVFVVDGGNHRIRKITQE